MMFICFLTHPWTTALECKGKRTYVCLTGELYVFWMCHFALVCFLSMVLLTPFIPSILVPWGYTLLTETDAVTNFSATANEMTMACLIYKVWWNTEASSEHCTQTGCHIVNGVMMAWRWDVGGQNGRHRDRPLLSLVGLVVKASATRSKDLGVQICLHLDFSSLSQRSDLKIGTPVATLPGAWRYGVSAGTGWPGVSILWLGEVESLLCNFYLSGAARKIVWADPSLIYTSMLLGC